MKKINISLIFSLIFLVACSPKGNDKKTFDTQIDSLAVFTDISTDVADFGTVATSTTKIYKFRNDGDSAGAATASLSSNSFAIILQTGCANVNVGGTCTIRVSFNPNGKAPNTYSSDLSIGGSVVKTVSATIAAASTGGTSSGGGSSIEASISGSPVVSPLDYGSFSGTQSSTKIIRLKNTGTTSTGPFSATISDTDFTFTLNSCSNKTLAPNGTCDVRVSFSASGKTAALYEANLVFGALTLPLQATVASSSTGGTTTGGGSANIVFLDGTTPIVAPLSFGTFTSATSLTKIITIKNTGTVATTSLSAILNSTDYSFLINGCLNKILAPNASCTARVTFSSSGKINSTFLGTLSFGTSSLSLTSTVSIIPTCTGLTHLDSISNTCVSNTRTCVILPSQASSGVENWNTTSSTWGSCQVSTCNDTYEVFNNQCLLECLVTEYRTIAGVCETIISSNGPPQVYSTNPNHEGQISTSGSAITVNFNQDMNENSYSNRIFVSGGYGVIIDSLLSDNNKVVFTINATIPNNNYYHITVSSDIKSLLNQPLSSDYHFSVRTGNPPQNLDLWQAPVKVFETGYTGYAPPLAFYDLENRKSIIHVISNPNQGNNNLTDGELVEFKSIDEGTSWEKIIIEPQLKSFYNSFYDTDSIGNYAYFIRFSTDPISNLSTRFVHYSDGSSWQKIALPYPLSMNALGDNVADNVRVAMSPTGQLAVVFRPIVIVGANQVDFSVRPRVMYYDGTTWSTPIEIGNIVNFDNFGIIHDYRIQYSGLNKFMIVLHQYDNSMNNSDVDLYSVEYNVATQTVTSPLQLDNTVSQPAGDWSLKGNIHGKMVLFLNQFVFEDPQNQFYIFKTINWNGSSWSSEKTAVAHSLNAYVNPNPPGIFTARVFDDNSAAIAYAYYNGQNNEEKGFLVKYSDLSNLSSSWSSPLRFNNYARAYDFSSFGGLFTEEVEIEGISSGVGWVKNISLRKNLATGEMGIVWNQDTITQSGPWGSVQATRTLISTISSSNVVSTRKIDLGGSLNATHLLGNVGGIYSYHQPSVFSSSTGFKVITATSTTDPLTGNQFNYEYYLNDSINLGNYGPVKRAFSESGNNLIVNMDDPYNFMTTSSSGDRAVAIFKYTDPNTGYLSYVSRHYNKSNDSWVGPTLDSRVEVIPAAQYMNSGQYISGINEECEPVYAKNSSGDAVIVWRLQIQSPGREKIFVRRYSASTGSWSPIRTVLDVDNNSEFGLSHNSGDRPMVALNEDGTAYIAWVEWDIVAQQYNLKIRGLSSTATLQSVHTLMSAPGLDYMSFFKLVGGGSKLMIVNQDSFALINPQAFGTITMTPFDENMTAIEKANFLSSSKIKMNGNNIVVSYIKEIPFESTHYYGIQMRYFNGTTWSSAVRVDNEPSNLPTHESEIFSNNKVIFSWIGEDFASTKSVVKTRFFTPNVGLSSIEKKIQTPFTVNNSKVQLCKSANDKVAVTVMANANLHGRNFHTILTDIYSNSSGSWMGTQYAHKPIDTFNLNEVLLGYRCSLSSSNRLFLLISPDTQNGGNTTYGPERSKILSQGVEF